MVSQCHVIPIVGNFLFLTSFGHSMILPCFNDLYHIFCPHCDIPVVPSSVLHSVQSTMLCAWQTPTQLGVGGSDVGGTSVDFVNPFSFFACKTCAVRSCQHQHPETSNTLIVC